MLRVLVPVDGSESSDRAVQSLINFIRNHEPMEIHVANVQEPVEAWEVKRFMPPEEIEAMQVSEGGDAIQSARKLLDAAGLAHTPHVELGPVAEKICELAQSLQCDLIIMGTHGRSALGHLLLGSVTSDVIQKSKIPVTLVK